MSWLYEPDGSGHDLDETDVRVRPNPKGNKPRTKIRPQHESAPVGMVLGVDLGRYRVLLNDGGRMVDATLAKELRKAGPVVGDIVALAGDTSETVGALARVVRIEPRKTLLRRSADDSDVVERVIVANADQMVIVVAIANPEPRTRLIDRYVAAAFDAGLRPILCITKTDLANPDQFISHFAGLDIPVILNRSDAPSLPALRSVLNGHTSVVVGHSGVGKSTMVNALVPGALLATGHVNAVTGRGRHTSTAVRAIALDGEIGATGWIIDTPGVRSFGLGHVKFENLIRSFEDLYKVIQECPRGCTHLAGAPDCGLDEAVEAGSLGVHGAARVDSLRRLMASLSDKSEY